ncbi:MAG: outer membrane beta-barrel protein [Cyclobacteriaceae bacterium]
MPTKIITLIATLFITISAKSQTTNWQPGFIIPSGRDTIKGFIDFKDWKQNPKHILFKDLNSKEFSYSANSISYFYISTFDEFYHGNIITTDQSSLRSNDVINLINQNIIKTDTVFLKVLVDGKISLFEFNDGNRLHYLYDDGTRIRELEVKKKRALQTSNTYGVATINLYKEQLKSLMKDCSRINSDINNLTYGSKGLTNIFREYHECSSFPISYINQSKDKFKFKFGIGTGVQITSIRLDSEVGFPTISSNDYSTPINPIIGISGEIIIPKNRESWSIANDLIFSNYSSTVNTQIQSGAAIYTSDVKIKFSYIKLMNLIRYKFITNRTLLPFLNFGISNSFALNSEFHSTREITDLGKTISRTERVDYEVRNHEQGLVLGGGVSFKKWSAEIQYESTNGFSSYSNLGTKVSYTRLFIVYNLNHKR